MGQATTCITKIEDIILQDVTLPEYFGRVYAYFRVHVILHIISFFLHTQVSVSKVSIISYHQGY